MPHKTFRDFVVANAGRDDPVGDFCGDSLRLEKFRKLPPEWLNYKKRILGVMGSWHHTCPEAYDAFKEAWAEWKAAR